MNTLFRALDKGRFSTTITTTLLLLAYTLYHQIGETAITVNHCDTLNLSNFTQGIGSIYYFIVCAVAIIANILVISVIYHINSGKNSWNQIPALSYSIVTLGCCSTTFSCDYTLLLTTPILWIVYILFSNRELRNGTGVCYSMAMLLTSCSMIYPIFILYIPIVIIGMGIMQILSFKGLLATLLGLITPIWIIWGGYSLEWLTFEPEKIVETLRQISPPSISQANIQEVIATILTSVVTLACILINGYNSYKDKAQTRTGNQYIVYLYLYTLLLVILYQGVNAPLVVLLNGVSALIIGHYFYNNPDKSGAILFWFLVTTNSILYLWSFFQQ